MQSCGNGQTDSADHKSHMAYRLANGSCPVTHPNLYPEVSLITSATSDSSTDTDPLPLFLASMM